MNDLVPILSVRMVINPPPAALRLRSTREQFPTFTLYETRICLLGIALPYAEIESLEMTPEGAISLKGRGRAYQYCVIGQESKEYADTEQTERLFRVLVALKSGGMASAREPLAEFQKTGRAKAKSMWIVAAIVIILSILTAVLKEFG